MLMKTMRFADMVVQTLIIVSAIVVAILNGFSFAEPDFLSVQLILGVWQMSSSFLSLIFGIVIPKKKLFHFITSIIYLLTLMTLAQFTRNESVYYIYLIGPPWVLAAFYYIVTLKINFPSSRRSKFLPHLGF
jgi:hypothetical protein